MSARNLWNASTSRARQKAVALSTRKDEERARKNALIQTLCEANNPDVMAMCARLRTDVEEMDRNKVHLDDMVGRKNSRSFDDLSDAEQAAFEMLHTLVSESLAREIASVGADVIAIEKRLTAALANVPGDVPDELRAELAESVSLAVIAET